MCGAWGDGGDLAAPAAASYIKGFDATAIWLTPSFKSKAVQLQDGPSAGSHVYWVTEVTQIDPHLAPTPSSPSYGDFFGLGDLFTKNPRVVRGMIDDASRG